MQSYIFFTHWDSLSFAYLKWEAKNSGEHEQTAYFLFKERYIPPVNEKENLFLTFFTKMILQIHKHSWCWKSSGHVSAWGKDRCRCRITSWRKSHISCIVVFSHFGSEKKRSRPEKSTWNLVWSTNFWRLWDRAIQTDYTEMCRHRIWHLLNMLSCLVTVSKALKNFPLWESHLMGHPQFLSEKFVINMEVKDSPEPDWQRTKSLRPLSVSVQTGTSGRIVRNPTVSDRLLKAKKQTGNAATGTVFLNSEYRWHLHTHIVVML